ncbi:uncharacterized protein LOC115627995 isoform X2 [Scaptodrosophila lebanonensis]|uniref:Uncharacterized protein LOC115627995 isoform X2 n=1 Tax=Drosophila lebanonensis TaxID=7225 RepID=A0A6J2TXX8_DROLE|nr:uncharacterized protein LOC115627995 isoform X2 [Scaptodrosophila lebanonensis]
MEKSAFIVKVLENQEPWELQMPLVARRSIPKNPWQAVADIVGFEPLEVPKSIVQSEQSVKIEPPPDKTGNYIIVDDVSEVASAFEVMDGKFQHSFLPQIEALGRAEISKYRIEENELALPAEDASLFKEDEHPMDNEDFTFLVGLYPDIKALSGLSRLEFRFGVCRLLHEVTHRRTSGSDSTSSVYSGAALFEEET